jgi:hypothetical protein
MHSESHTVGAEQVSQHTLEAFYPVPTFIHSYKRETDQLHRTNLFTGERSSHRVPSNTFKYACCWSEAPAGSLLITGGSPGVREVVTIDTRKELACSNCPPMLTPRAWHSAVYHTPHLYPWRIE